MEATFRIWGLAFRRWHGRIRPLACPSPPRAVLGPPPPPAATSRRCPHSGARSPCPFAHKARLLPGEAGLTPSTLATSRLSFSSRRSRARTVCCRPGSGSPVFLRTASSCKVRSGRGRRPAGPQRGHRRHRDPQPRPLPPPGFGRGRSGSSGHPRAPQNSPARLRPASATSFPFLKGPPAPALHPTARGATSETPGQAHHGTCPRGPGVMPRGSRPCPARPPSSLSSGPRRARGSPDTELGLAAHPSSQRSRAVPPATGGPLSS